MWHGFIGRWLNSGSYGPGGRAKASPVTEQSGSAGSGDGSPMVTRAPPADLNSSASRGGSRLVSGGLAAVDVRDFAGDPGASLGLLGGRARWPVSGQPVTLWVRGLPHFDQMTVGIADVANASRTGAVSAASGIEHPGAPFGVYGIDVFDPDIEAVDPVGIAWRLQGDRRLIVGRSSAGIDDDPAVG